MLCFCAAARSQAGVTRILVDLHPEIRVEYGWGAYGKKAESPVMYASMAAGKGVPVPSADYDHDYLFDGTGTAASKTKGFVDIRSGAPGENTTATIMHPIVGEAHYITDIALSYKYIAGYGPPSAHKKGSVMQVVVVDFETRNDLVSLTTLSHTPYRERSYLEDTAGCGSLLPPASADVRSSGDVIASEGVGLHLTATRPVQLRQLYRVLALDCCQGDRSQNTKRKGSLH